jgi:hypothetical protein
MGTIRFARHRPPKDETKRAQSVLVLDRPLPVAEPEGARQTQQIKAAD